MGITEAGNRSARRRTLRSRLIKVGVVAAASLGLTLGGVTAANAADGSITCGGNYRPFTFSYTSSGNPNAHRHQQIGGSGAYTVTKWEGGNYTTSTSWTGDRYTLSGSNKSAWCGN